MKAPRIVLLFCSFAITAAAMSQLPGPLAKGEGAFDEHCDDMLLLQAKPIQKELGVTQAQRDQMNVFAVKHDKGVADYKKKTAGAKTDPSRALYALYSQMKMSVLGVLTPAQRKRLREVSLQHIGLLALCDPVVAKRIGISDDQVGRLRSAYDEGFKKYQTAEQVVADGVYGPYKGITPKSQADADRLNKEIQTKLKAARATIEPRLSVIRETYDQRMRAVLTAAQIKTYNELRGRPYKP